jgi:hypothetical protein
MPRHWELSNPEGPAADRRAEKLREKRKTPATVRASFQLVVQGPPSGSQAVQVPHGRMTFMPRKVVDLSARSAHIRDEPWDLHFWESTPEEALAFLRDPRKELTAMGIDLPKDCRIETIITNHDWMSDRTEGLAADDRIIICNVGGGNRAVAFYKVTMYAHEASDVGRFDKPLLHSVEEEARVIDRGDRG